MNTRRYPRTLREAFGPGAERTPWAHEEPPAYRFVDRLVIWLAIAVTASVLGIAALEALL